MEKKKQLRKDLEAQYNLKQDIWGHYSFICKGYAMRINFQEEVVCLEASTIDGWRHISATPANLVNISDFTLWLNDPSFGPMASSMKRFATEMKYRGWTKATLAKRWGLTLKDMGAIMRHPTQRDCDGLTGLPVGGAQR